ncbi:transcriptional regulator [Alphaproteobacteria bacterium]|nr:transcriptional regulator [Alphaproteobacteria bacterium]
MKKEHILSIPTQRALKKFGADIRAARIRRRITMAIMSERAMITPFTLAKVEKGDPSVSFGIYASVIFVLGMIDKIYSLLDISEDLVGRSLDEERLPKRVRTARAPMALPPD